MQLLTSVNEKGAAVSLFPLQFNLTADDVAVVLTTHGVPPTQELVDWVFDDAERIAAAAADREDLSDQVDAALAEIETVLLENKVITGRRIFNA